jgi:hypothetical protein
MPKIHHPYLQHVQQLSPSLCPVAQTNHLRQIIRTLRNIWEKAGPDMIRLSCMVLVSGVEKIIWTD